LGISEETKLHFRGGLYDLRDHLFGDEEAAGPIARILLRVISPGGVLINNVIAHAA